MGGVFCGPCCDRSQGSSEVPEREPHIFHAHVEHHHNHDPEHHRADGYGSESDSSDDCKELEDGSSQKNPRHWRRYAASNTKFGAYNKRIIGSYEVKCTPKSQGHRDILMNVVRNDELFLPAIERNQTELLVSAFEVITASPNSHLVDLHASATEFFVVLEGYVELSTSHHGEKSTTRLISGEYFGDEALMWHTTWTLSAVAGPQCVIAKMSRTCYQTIVVEKGMKERERRISCLHKVIMFETFNDELIAKIEEVLHLRVYHPGDVIVREGQLGHHFFILESGECQIFKGSQDFTGEPIAVLGMGALFGERALLDQVPRSASVIAKTDVELLVLSRGKFERLLGPMQNLHKEHSIADPRHTIANFFGQQGQSGHVESSKSPSKGNVSTHWFAVFRPTSRDSITKLVSRQGVGKGLNIKGKSAKKGALSGFVPFLQISTNEHKHDIEASPVDAWLKVFYRSKHARDDAVNSISKILHNPEFRQHIELENPHAKVEELLIMRDEYAPGSYGIKLPETVLHEAYIEIEDLTPHSGWETGRESEPAFMDMNLHSIRGGSSPEIVLWQFDEAHPMNPHGLLMAYAETEVKPVVSDFDAFVIGSTSSMNYSPMPAEQVKLQNWALDRTEEILSTPSNKSWTSRWLKVLADLAMSGEHHEFPPFGYGDETSVGLIQTAVDVLRSSGAIRHGPECFNFHFPQELDDEYLIVWEGVKDGDDADAKPFAYFTEKGLREFLIARAKDGFTFPVNPVWPIRDPGWYDVFAALKANPNSKQALESWYPASSGILDRVEDIAQRFPRAFETIANTAGEYNSEEPSSSCATKMESAESILHQVRRIAKGEEGKKKQRRRTSRISISDLVRLKTSSYN
jgi:CRP-like cAMP-binding protein